MGLYDDLSPLEEGQIRLLQVSPRSETTSPGIACSLVVVSLREQPSYFALSYTWGDPFPNYGQLESKRDVLMTCNGTKIFVKPNLYDFLLHCAGHVDPAFRGLVWVDALCINQKDHLERSKQVQFIGEIYKSAAQVVVWLGVEGNSTASAVKLMREFTAADPAYQDITTLSAFSLADLIRVLRPDQSGCINLNPARFFERNWFERAWIIQEITFARQAIVLCGPHTLGWDEITTVSKFVATEFSATSIWSDYFEGASHPDTEFADRIRTRRAHFPAKLAATKASKSGTSGDGLLYALIRSRASKCEDARDKVYSQLKLGNADIFPTYSNDETQVYITAATYILQNSDNLLLLTCVEGPDFQEMKGLPSWVPDWSVSKDLGLRVTGYRHFKAAGSLPRNYTITSGGRRLQMQAAKIDTITRIAETKGELLDFSRPTSLWEMVAELDNMYAQTGQSKEEVLWRTLTTNRGRALHSDAVQYPASTMPLQDSFAKWILWRYFVANKLSPGLEASSFPILNSPQSMLPTRAAIFHHAERSSPEDRATLEKESSIFHSHYSHALFLRPFRTQEGFFGLVTQSLREGDSVWVVPGCRVPLILRKVEDSERYRLVGGTLLHGFMNGEALEREGIRFDMVELE
ncbi:uncharacterized protein N0V89_001083 [Didymosphaeria variabile]|uniref:Heterokaryon incompatibility domain-containing protein n=1 Tax=Didymosphaeria variabile TaxID=1932322 RepID=A0A9W8XWG1_9PLEO|nr:uncharacterized protein N0V89_001083 [Didymosphaeria variabile]KAJ4360518.1 hypothetical protein N0V89_001083 [Didymosphaeria variabile]